MPRTDYATTKFGMMKRFSASKDEISKFEFDGSYKLPDKVWSRGYIERVFGYNWKSLPELTEIERRDVLQIWEIEIRD